MTTTGGLTTSPDERRVARESSGLPDERRVTRESSGLPDELRVGRDFIRFRVTSAQTGGTLAAAEVRMPAGGGPPLLHRHAPAEVYRVVHGELAIYLEGEEGAVGRVAAGPGGVVHIPAGRKHTIRNESGADSLAYVVYFPGAPMEALVRDAAALPSPPSTEAVMELARRHGIEMTGPVPAG